MTLPCSPYLSRECRTEAQALYDRHRARCGHRDEVVGMAEDILELCHAELRTLSRMPGLDWTAEALTDAADAIEDHVKWHVEFAREVGLVKDAEADERADNLVLGYRAAE